MIIVGAAEALTITQVLANFGLLVALLCGRVVQQIFFGALRPAEVEVCPLFCFKLLQ